MIITNDNNCIADDVNTSGSNITHYLSSTLFVTYMILSVLYVGAFYMQNSDDFIKL